MSAKIRSVHLSRPAVFYIRQSSLMQVLEHQESTQRQYALTSLAQRLGWDVSQIQVIDEDLGKSGQSAENRSGFQRHKSAVQCSFSFRDSHSKGVRTEWSITLQKMDSYFRHDTHKGMLRPRLASSS